MNRFNGGSDNNTSLTDGTVNAVLASLKIPNMAAGFPVKINSDNKLVSEKINPSDINSVILTNPYAGDLKASDFETDDYFSINDEIQKIDNLTASTATDTNLTGILNTDELSSDKLYDKSKSVWIDLTTTDISVNATNFIVNSANLPDLITTNTGAISTINGKIGSNLGIASLDGAGKLPISQLPLNTVIYCGTWNASTNTPTIATGVAPMHGVGCYSVVNVAGNTNVDGITDWQIGDWIIWNGTVWQKVDNTDQVSAVNGLKGSVVLNMETLNNVDITSPVANEILKYNGTSWINNTLAEADIATATDLTVVETKTQNISHTLNSALTTVAAQLQCAQLNTSAIKDLSLTTTLNLDSTSVNVDANSLVGTGTLGTVATPWANGHITTLNTGAVESDSLTLNSYKIKLGALAGQTNQGLNAVAIGYLSGQTNQLANSVSIGHEAAKTNQGIQSVSMGYFAGQTSQSNYSIAIGSEAGKTTQRTNSVAIGTTAGQVEQDINCVAIGNEAGVNEQKEHSVAIGWKAGKTRQKRLAIAIGTASGETDQGEDCIAMGREAGQITQGQNSIALGYVAGKTTQGDASVAIGSICADVNQGDDAVAIGHFAGKTTQGDNSVAIGLSAGLTTQGGNSVAIGNQAGLTTQSDDCIAIGRDSGQSTQGQFSVALGLQAGNDTQGGYSVAIGYQAGRDTQQFGSVAIGSEAGEVEQGIRSVAVGGGTAKTRQGNSSIAMGFNAASEDQKNNAIAIGTSSGRENQGENSIAIGNAAGNVNQHDNSTIINSTGSVLNSGIANALYIAPIRNYVQSITDTALYYNPTTKEISTRQSSVTTSIGAGAGVSPSLTQTSYTGSTGVIYVTIGSAPVTNSPIVNFTTDNPGLMLFSPANAAAAALAIASTPILSRTSATQHIFRSNTTAMTAATTFTYYYYFV